MIEFACQVDDIADDDQFVTAIKTLLARQARRYRCSAQVIFERYASAIADIGPDEYFLGFRPELN